MNEVTKLYKNAGVSCKPNYVYNKVPILSGLKYPPFTAEKQLELIKWLVRKNFYDERIIRSNFEKTCFYCSYINDYYESEYFEKFEEALANVFNYFWQDLTEEERKQIKNILE